MEVHQDEVVESSFSSLSINNSTNNGNLHDLSSSVYIDPSTLPWLGYVFAPKDKEIVEYYLKKKVPIPMYMWNNVDLYKYSPEYLAENYKPLGDKQWYFFTPRYGGGEHSNRVAGDGFWKPAGPDHLVLSNGSIIGFKKNFWFYKGEPTRGEETDWLLQEYRLNDTEVGDCVLCRIVYYIP